jgi:cytoskeletal protein CcmA (bactofilin family)
MTENASYQPTVAPARTLSEIPRPRRDDYSHKPAAASPQESRMTVGPQIRLKGEISNCDVLVVEGDVEATVETKMLEVAEGGTFKGTATVEASEIHGAFEGTLTIAGLLRIHGTGRLSGKVRYGKIEVQSGGELSGDIASAGSERAGKSAASEKPAPTVVAGEAS